ncbi:uncharacterized protein BJ171DRAFT_602027 [Polychytrium aggregatum]|uniref:uncharacterized protein n=1 Tax=Polychytrium aggregatum TaxID=110093 RepID=UPI0022FEF8A0|nr:uncharacterized protein BJ171DRAFT_602027 [Polychytrium aggregatum]KAI9199251.1 hypothetical protein BJ171DRAFT_602027 [Polychytrium aggregatum]
MPKAESTDPINAIEPDRLAVPHDVPLCHPQHPGSTATLTNSAASLQRETFDAAGPLNDNPTHSVDPLSPASAEGSCQSSYEYTGSPPTQMQSEQRSSSLISPRDGETSPLSPLSPSSVGPGSCNIATSSDRTLKLGSAGASVPSSPSGSHGSLRLGSGNRPGSPDRLTRRGSEQRSDSHEPSTCTSFRRESLDAATTLRRNSSRRSMDASRDGLVLLRSPRRVSCEYQDKTLSDIQEIQQLRRGQVDPLSFKRSSLAILDKVKSIFNRRSRDLDKPVPVVQSPKRRPSFETRAAPDPPHHPNDDATLKPVTLKERRWSFSSPQAKD